MISRNFLFGVHALLVLVCHDHSCWSHSSSTRARRRGDIENEKEVPAGPGAAAPADGGGGDTGGACCPLVCLAMAHDLSSSTTSTMVRGRQNQQERIKKRNTSSGPNYYVKNDAEQKNISSPFFLNNENSVVAVEEGKKKQAAVESTSLKNADVVRDLVISGSDASEGSYPWYASLHVATAVSGLYLEGFYCGGQLVSPDFVLSGENKVVEDAWIVV